MSVGVVQLDETGRASLDGTWELFAGDVGLEGLDAATPQPIQVPGLWEAQGHLELDGPAWYRTSFELAEVDGWWTLRFGAVMDLADVWCNGVHLGSHDNPFTPFAVDPTPVLRPGRNELAVRVVDPSVDDPAHIRLAHGKQGWANHVFPSRPSLYMTYGGIWQSVELRRHGPVVVDDVFVDGDPEGVVVTVTLENRSDEPYRGQLDVRALGAVVDRTVEVAARSTSTATIELGASPAPRWTPARPVLHTAHVDLVADGRPSDGASVRFGLRTVRTEGRDILVGGERYRMKSVLVQGFTADELYAEGPRAHIEAEVRAALAMGFNTLRLHIKAFHPTYLDVCDEMGMLVHCDIPVAEPIAHEELGAEGTSEIATRSAQAVRDQIRRDRNHPSIILWSVMNELCLDRIEARAWDGYEAFARSLVAAARRTDPTRPIIENDWVEPDPDRVFAADVLTAHWYGRLHAEYLAKIEAACRRWADLDRPLLVSEFGDWGLPEMPELAAPPFWDTRTIYAAGLAGTLWPSTVGRFVRETQRYQGLSDRLQAEVFRRHDHIGGYCLTELTDVPHELNGLLDLHRRPKALAVAEVARANQIVLPMLHLDSLVVVAGEPVRAVLHVSNDGPPVGPAEVEVRFGGTGAPLGMGELLAIDASGLDLEALLLRFDEGVASVRTDVRGHVTEEVGPVELAAPLVPGSHDLVVRLRSEAGTTAENRYPVHVVAPPSADGIAVEVLGSPGPTPAALGRIGASAGPGGVPVVAEDALDAEVGRAVAERLAAGQTVVVLAQRADLAPHNPAEVTLVAVETEWGSSVFHFTTDNGALPSLPRRNVLVAEDSTVQAHSVVASIGGVAFPDVPVVIAYKPVPGAMTGTVVGSHDVGPGRLVFCQYRLCEAAAAGDAAARALLADLLRWAAVPRAQLAVERTTGPGGQAVARYRHVATTAR